MFAEPSDSDGRAPSFELNVTFGAVPVGLADGRTSTPFIDVVGGQALVRLFAGARLLVSDGARVVVDVPDTAIWQGETRWLIQGWAIAVAALQRGELSLHAGCVDIAGVVVAVAGDTGAGKSITAMGLRSRGHALLVDDVTLIEFHDGAAHVKPFSRNVHLMPDAAAALGIDFEALPILAGGREKAAFTPEPQPVRPRRIDAVLVLEPTDEARGVTVQALRGTEGVLRLREHTRRHGIAPLIMGEEAYFRALTSLAASTRVYVLSGRRPRGPLTRYSTRSSNSRWR